MEYPKRKQIRLQNYDYSSPGAYFITICTKDKQNLFWRGTPSVGAAIRRPQNEAEANKTFLPVQLTEIGLLVDQSIRNIPTIYSMILLEKYVVMPNHVHLLLRIDGGEDGRRIAAPTVSTVVNQMKGWSTKQAGRDLWQKSFHEHVIRDRNDYTEIWRYIDENPIKWEDDCYFVE